MFDTDKFIQFIQEQPSLWEKGCAEYMNRNMREKSWLIVGENMFSSWQEITDDKFIVSLENKKN